MVTLAKKAFIAVSAIVTLAATLVALFGGTVLLPSQARESRDKIDKLEKRDSELTAEIKAQGESHQKDMREISRQLGEITTGIEWLKDMHEKQLKGTP